MASESSILDTRHLTLLRAAMGDGEVAKHAYLTWRDKTILDEIDYTAHRVLPLMFATVRKFGIEDRDSQRMRGIAKHIWLSNMLQLRILSQALHILEGEHIEALVLKGGALFARNPEIAAQRMSEDYDLQIRPRDVSRALKALTGAGFTTYLDVERLTPRDFEAIHGVPMVKDGFKGSIDLHWRPLHRADDSDIVGDMFAGAEPARLANQGIRVPDRATHLLLAVAGTDPSERHEAFFRIVEAAHVVRDCGGELDWPRFLHLVGKHRTQWTALHVMRLIRNEAGAPVPAHVIDELARRTPISQRLAMRWRARRGARDTSLRRLLLVTHPWRLPPRPYELRPPRPLPARLQWIVENRLRRAWKALSRSTRELTAVDYAFGFSTPETEGRWTAGDLAIITVPAPAGARVTVDITAMPFVPPGRSDFNFRSFAGVKIGRHCARYSDGAVRIRLEALVSSGGKAVVALQLDDACSPAALGLNTDQRYLGLLVKDVTVVADGAEINGRDGAPRSLS